MTQRQQRIQQKPRPTRSTTTRSDHSTPATERREIRKDIARVWWPES
jgi:hypothetical protein